MTWTTNDHELLTRCADSARAGDPANPGMLSRFYKALSSCRSLTLKSVGKRDLEVALDALSVAGRPPMDASRRAGVVLLELAKGSRVPDIRDAAVDALTAYWTNHPPLDPATPRDLYSSERVDTPRTFRLALLAGEDADVEYATSLLPDLDLGLDELKSIHARLLDRGAFGDATLELLAELYSGSSWLNRRVLIRQVGQGHEVLVPVLARVARHADPSTRRTIVAALSRVGHVSVEPVLVSLLDDVEPGVARDIVGILGELGTRACMPRISQVRDDLPELADAVDASIALIDARAPVRADGGALSLAEEGPAGALSLAGASPGDVSLYLEVERQVEENALVAAPPNAIALGSSWHRLATAPRELPLGFTLRSIGIGRWGVNLVVWLMMSAFTLVEAKHFLINLLFPASMAMLLGIGAWHYRRHRRLLCEGTGAFAEYVDTEYRHHGKGHTIDYVYRYMDELERTHAVKFRVEVEVPAIKDEPLEPLLFMPDGEVMLFDEISYLSVSDDGALVDTSWLNLLGALPPLTYALSLAYFLYTLST